jgi:uncharacterized protein (TIGR02118 family)
MVTLIAMYPTNAASFDRPYYFEKHMPLVEAKWKPLGLTKSEVQTVAGTGAGGPAPYHVVTLLYFKDMAALQNAVGSPEGAAVVDDIKNFYGGDPVLLITAVSTAP